LSTPDPELIRRAEAAGIAPRYRDWRDHDAEVSAETLAAILDALDSGPAPAGPPPGDSEHLGEPGRPRVPGRRAWGFTV